MHIFHCSWTDTRTEERISWLSRFWQTNSTSLCSWIGWISHRGFWRCHRCVNWLVMLIICFCFHGFLRESSWRSLDFLDSKLYSSQLDQISFRKRVTLASFIFLMHDFRIYLVIIGFYWLDHDPNAIIVIVTIFIYIGSIFSLFIILNVLDWRYPKASILCKEFKQLFIFWCPTLGLNNL